MFEEKLENGLVMRNVRSEEDKVKYANLSYKFNNASEGDTCTLLLGEHKGMTGENFFLVEDTNTGEFLATICLIPWKMNFDGISINAAMLEMVLSHPEYRKLGLVKKLINQFLAQVDQQGFDISVITGIPYYYRQYGYTYGLDLGTVESLPAFKIPEQKKEILEKYSLRKAESKDIGDLDRLYRVNTGNKNTYIERSPEHWRYLIEKAKYDIRLLLATESNSVLGYFMLKESEDKKSITIFEGEVPNYEKGLIGLGLIKTEDTKEIVICSYTEDVLSKLAQNLGSKTVRNTQWLVRTHDSVRFLNTIKPILEKRLEEGGCKGITTDVIVNLFRYAIKLKINEGKIEEIKNVGFVDSSMGSDGGDLCIPNDAFIRLLFGYRTVEELWDAWPDIVIKSERKHIIEALFPVLKTYLYTPYHYQG